MRFCLLLTSTSTIVIAQQFARNSQDGNEISIDPYSGGILQGSDSTPADNVEVPWQNPTDEITVNDASSSLINLHSSKLLISNSGGSDGLDAEESQSNMNGIPMTETMNPSTETDNLEAKCAQEIPPTSGKLRKRGEPDVCTDESGKDQSGVSTKAKLDEKEINRIIQEDSVWLHRNMKSTRKSEDCSDPEHPEPACCFGPRDMGHEMTRTGIRPIMSVGGCVDFLILLSPRTNRPRCAQEFQYCCALVARLRHMRWGYYGINCVSLSAAAQ